MIPSELQIQLTKIEDDEEILIKELALLNKVVWEVRERLGPYEYGVKEETGKKVIKRL